MQSIQTGISMPIGFEVLAQDQDSRARIGRLKTPRGSIETPVFMPVGTAGSVKAMWPDRLTDLGVRIILANTYHLYLRPGVEVIEKAGGLHRFMDWPDLLLTDSGGYQVFSHRGLIKVSEEGVQFTSHLDGSRHFLGPEDSIRVQRTLDADIIMAFDECTPYPVTHAEARGSMDLSMRWLTRCLKAAEDRRDRLFGIVQGGVFPDLRAKSLEQVMAHELPGIALGGFSVGEPRAQMLEMVGRLTEKMPVDRPRYLMGVGTPLDLVAAVGAGCDMFDCVLPTRNARRGHLFTWHGPVRIKNARYRTDFEPVDSRCGCVVCRRFSRAYLRHLFVAGEVLSSILNTYHNLYFYLELMTKVRHRIRVGGLARLQVEIEDAYKR